MTISSTVNRSRTSAPARSAASTRILSSTVRRGPYAVELPAYGGGVPLIVNGPKSNEYVSTAGAPLSITASEQAPAAQRVDAGGVDEVGGHGVARERRAVDQEHAVALLGEQHRCG